MNKFYKVSLAQYVTDGGKEADYEDIRLPKRATSGSAGYDFYAPESFSLEAGETIKIPTGIRCQMNSDLVLMIYPRSGLGFKYRLTLDNTVGVIDSDYFGAKNEGHIMIKMTNNGTKPLSVNKGEAVAQGIFLKYYLTDDDDASGVRTGGFGSTT